VTLIGKSTAGHTVNVPGSAEPAVVLSWGLDTHTGYRRRHNEDSAVAAPPIFAVADGMGGHSAGDVASKAVVTRLAEMAGNQVTTVAEIDSALKAATADISLAADNSRLGVGTTVTGAALMAKDGVPHWAIFNVGDSRVYLYEGTKLSQVTVDHSVVQELVDAGMISAGEAEQHPDSNIITRAVGFNADPITDYWLIPLSRGMRLLLCSDGLTKEVGNDMLAEHLASGHPAEQTAGLLVDAALAAGGRDNVTVLVIDVVEGPIAEDE
jgi:protein phosphatase